MYVKQNKLHQSNNAFQHTHNPIDEEGTQKFIKVIKVHMHTRTTQYNVKVIQKTADSYLFTVETELKAV